MTDYDSGLPEPGGLIFCDVIFSQDTSAYASADLLADAQVVTNAVAINGGMAELVQVNLIDQDDQKNAMSMVFQQTSQTLGSENSAPGTSDALLLAAVQLGFIPIAATDYVDLGGLSVGCIRPNPPLRVKAAAGTRSIYVALVNGAGTPTYTATGLRATLIFRPVNEVIT